MLEGEDVLKICIQHRITIEQYFVLYLISRRDFHKADNQSLGKQYLLTFGMFKPDIVGDLIERGFIDDFNSPGQFYPEMYVLKDEMNRIFAYEDMADEFYEAYPPTFKLGDKGSRFIARAGGDKDEMLQLYLKKINFSVKKHEQVLKVIPYYVQMVDNGEINGYKLIDFIKQELWDVIIDMAKEQKKGVDYGRDI